MIISVLSSNGSFDALTLDQNVYPSPIDRAAITNKRVDFFLYTRESEMRDHIQPSYSRFRSLIVLLYFRLDDSGIKSVPWGADPPSASTAKRWQAQSSLLYVKKSIVNGKQKKKNGWSSSAPRDMYF